MKPYDAKCIQLCLICGFRASHNKNGQFSSHLLNNHNIKINDYLYKYYYSTKDLKCSYELCQKSVDLRRGKPKKHCSRSCANKHDPLKCIHCGKKFYAMNRSTKTCGPSCAKSIKSRKIKEWHANMPKIEKELHFKRIIAKTASTRIKNKTPSWNSGKTGIYTQETIEKIRSATLKQMEHQTFRKTNIEKLVESYLIMIDVNYRYSYILEKRQYDFLLVDYKILIECDGDYWHANPKFYPKPAEWQLERIIIDQEKNEIATKNGYIIIRFWEDDILNNFKYVESKIASYMTY
ncbi:endonuclease domain-containing protein [Metabacillus herbersteinensis]|uniref:Endonuclease domain-containing protein n=1 Tax=Metabacillus herbersteinensis TaxID=283816 RepID=A0ABV6G8D6_9BACI